MYHGKGECNCKAHFVVLGCMDLEMEDAIEEERMKEFIAWLEERLATGEGGNPPVYIGWDDATRNYVISQHDFSKGSSKMLSCSKSLGKAVELAVSGKVFD